MDKNTTPQPLDWMNTPSDPNAGARARAELAAGFSPSPNEPPAPRSFVVQPPPGFGDWFKSLLRPDKTDAEKAAEKIEADKWAQKATELYQQQTRQHDETQQEFQARLNAMTGRPPAYPSAPEGQTVWDNGLGPTDPYSPAPLHSDYLP